ncbi:MAG TPA: PqqD family protein [Anaerolineae bacterium]|nr:PqqD family protein [Anaerolineae bacterium]
MHQPHYFKFNTPRVVQETIEGETVMIDFDSGAYYSTDQVGALICSLLEKRAGVGEILAFISSHCSANPVDIEAGVQQFLAELQAESLIIPAAAPANHPSLAEVAPLTCFEPPRLYKYTDMQDLLLLDPIHEVDEAGWPLRKQN